MTALFLRVGDRHQNLQIRGPSASSHRATHRSSSSRPESSSPATPRPGFSLFHSSPSSTTAPIRTSPSSPACSSATPTTTSPFPPTAPRSTSSGLPTVPTSPLILPLCAPATSSRTSSSSPPALGTCSTTPYLSATTSDYALSLRDLRTCPSPRSSVAGGAGHRVVEAPRMFWMGMPALVTSLLNTEEKRRRMGPGMWAAYDREVGESRLLRGQGRPLFLLDMALLSRGCGVGCTADGMHCNRVVYDVALRYAQCLVDPPRQQQQQQQ